jgi:hypothetical protein
VSVSRELVFNIGIKFHKPAVSSVCYDHLSLEKLSYNIKLMTPVSMELGSATVASSDRGSSWKIRINTRSKIQFEQLGQAELFKKKH